MRTAALDHRPLDRAFVSEATPARLAPAPKPPAAPPRAAAAAPKPAPAPAPPPAPAARQSTRGHQDGGVFEVDDGIPLPATAYGRMGYPFARLEVGQSFWVERDQSKSFTSVTRANSRHAPKVFTARFMHGTDPKHPGKFGYRVWRVK